MKKYITIIPIVVIAVLFSSTVIASVIAHSATSKAKTYKANIERLETQLVAKDSVIKQLKQLNRAEVQCLLEVNFKNNRKGVVVIDSEMSAEKIGKAVRDSLKKQKVTK